MRSRLKTSYDNVADVLYVYARKGVYTRNLENDAGLVLRYDEKTDAPVGATVVDFKEYWSHHRAKLASRLAAFFGVSKDDAEAILRTADAARR